MITQKPIGRDELLQYIRPVLAYAGLVGLGILGNLGTVELFFNVDLVFGSIAVLVIVSVFGLVPGVIAAAVVALPTLTLWNQPYAIAVFTLEALFVGLVLKRRGGNILLVDAAFWLSIGFLVNVFVYGQLLQLSAANMWVVVLKQGVNGVVNALVAGVIVSVLPVVHFVNGEERTSVSVSITDAILYTITGFVVVPALLVFTLQSRMALQATEQEVQDRLVSIGNALELTVNQRVEGIARALHAVARSWTEDPHTHESLARFVRFGSDALGDVSGLRISDSSYRVQAMYPGSAAAGERLLSAHDFDAVTATFDDQGLGISSTVYMHGALPSLSIARPWVDGGEIQGIVFGTLRLDNIQRQLQGIGEPWGLQATIIGPDERVLVSTNPDMTANEPVRYMRYGSMTELDTSLFVHVPDHAHDTAAVQRWYSSSYILVRDLSQAAGWTLVLSAPLAPYQAALSTLSIQSLIVVFALVFGTIVLSRVFGVAMVRSLALLSRTTTGLPTRILESNGVLEWPQTGIREVQMLINNFRDASQHIAESVHELQTINADLVSAKRSADAANRAKSRFLANMSHDLRTPLNGILGYAQILSRDEHLGAEYREAVGIIEKSGNRLLGLLNDVLDLSRIEADRIERVDSPVDVDSLLTELIAMVQVQAEQKGLRLEQELDPALPQIIETDEKKLQQILTNLVSNAVKFTLTGEVRVAARRSDDGQRIVFSVSDTGVGIPEHEQQAVFSPFIQGDKPRVDGEGTGLGLAIVKRLAEFLGGAVSVTSRVGEGSSFFVELPLTAYGSSESAHTQPRNSSQHPGTSYRDVVGYTGRTRHVLVADDAEANRRLLSDLLVPLGFTVDEASDGVDVLNRARERHPDLIILDVVMPVADGFQAFRSLQADSELRHVPVIAGSGSVAEQVRDECLRMGFAGFVEKPYSRDTILALIGRVLQLEFTGPAPADPRTGEERDVANTPSAEEVSDIADALRRGDIRAVLLACEELADAQPDYRAYCDLLTSLARGFKLQAVADLLPGGPGEH